MSHSSSWRLLPSFPSASLSTNLLERKAKVRTEKVGGGWFLECSRKRWAAALVGRLDREKKGQNKEKKT